MYMCIIVWLHNIENVGKRTIRILIGRLRDVMGAQRQCLPWHTSVGIRQRRKRQQNDL